MFPLYADNLLLEELLSEDYPSIIKTFQIKILPITVKCPRSKHRIVCSLLQVNLQHNFLMSKVSFFSKVAENFVFLKPTTRKCRTLWGRTWASWYRKLCHTSSQSSSYIHSFTIHRGLWSAFACWFTNLSWYIAGFVTISNVQVAKSSPEKAKYHICQPFLQPGQLM